MIQLCNWFRGLKFVIGISGLGLMMGIIGFLGWFLVRIQDFGGWVVIGVDCRLFVMFFGCLLFGVILLGQLLDVLLCLVVVLVIVDMVVVEDIWWVWKLVKVFDIWIGGWVVSLFDWVEVLCVMVFFDVINNGVMVLVVSDVGILVISDFGYWLVVVCIDVGVLVMCLFGLFVVIIVLVMFGLLVEKFCFEGFVLCKGVVCWVWLVELVEEWCICVFFEFLCWLVVCFNDVVEQFGGVCLVVICWELIKVYEEVVCGLFDELVIWVVGGVFGEIIVVVVGVVFYVELLLLIV